MPDNYELTVGKLQSYISDDQICTILNSSNITIANKKILDYLIERMSCREELLDLCDQLENISTSHDLNIVINEIRFGLYCYCAIIIKIVTLHFILLGVQQRIQFPISAAVTTITEPLLSTDQQPHFSPSE